MTNAKTFTRPFPIMIIAVGLGASDVASARPMSICAERNEAANEMILMLDNGCVSSSIRYLGQDIEVDIDENHAWIRVSGGFNYEKLPAGKVVTADCGGGQRLEIKVPDAGARRYSVSRDDMSAGFIDLISASGPACATPPSADTIAHTRLLMEWASVDPERFGSEPAASLMDAVAPIHAGHPESTEGAPTLELDAAPWPGEPAMQVRIVMMGYLDDSVSGEQFVARVEEADGGWVLKQVWTRRMCGRGAHAGQWTTDLCL